MTLGSTLYRKNLLLLEEQILACYELIPMSCDTFTTDIEKLFYANEYVRIREHF